MRQELITLPSSCQILFRQLLIRDESRMASARNKKGANLDKTLTEVMTDCAVEIVDEGPYNFLSAGGKPNWDMMAKGDRFGTMIDLHCLSYREGHLYEFELRCPHCNQKFGWEVNLKTDLLRQPFPEESISRMKTGEPFEVTIDGKLVKYTVALGKTEHTYTLLCEQYPEREMAAALRARIVSVEGVEPRHYMDWLDGNNGEKGCKYPGLSSEEGEELRDAFDRVDGGVDTALEAQCTVATCKQWFDYTLPFTGMFLPGKGISKRRRAARNKAEQKMRTQASEDPKQEDTGEAVTEKTDQ
jgi:hypothetical protein